MGFPACEPDIACIGKLRALGRLLRLTGNKLRDAVPAAIDGDGQALNMCAAALGGVADSLMRDQWAQAGDLLGSARVQCTSLFPQEHLASLQRLFNAPCEAAVDGLKPQNALLALGRILEARAESLSEAYETLQDALFDAAGTLRAAARLFSVPGARVEAQIDAVTLDFEASPQMSLEEISRMLAAVPMDKRKRLLRALARQHHPDRHVGREMEVLPVFLHVQRLREELQHTR